MQNILSAFNFLGSAFTVVPTNTCVPCGGPTEFYCSTTAFHTLSTGDRRLGTGSQLWMIHFLNGTTLTISSNEPNNVPRGYQLISPSKDEYRGLRVLDADSTYNGATFKCIAFTPENVGEQNDSAAAVTLEVGG